MEANKMPHPICSNGYLSSRSNNTFQKNGRLYFRSKFSSFANKKSKTVREFPEKVCNESSLHGLRHFFAPNTHILEKIFWIITVLSATFTMLAITKNVFHRYQFSPTVISMERDYLSWNASFPGATVCFKKIDVLKLDKVVSEFNVTDKEKLRDFILDLSNVTMLSSSIMVLDDHPAVPPEKYSQLLESIQLPFVPQLLTSLNFKVNIQKTISEIGFCYSINSRIAIYNSIQYWNSNIKSTVPETPFAVHQLEGEMFIQLGDFLMGYSLYIHGQMEVPQMSDKNYFGPRLTYRSLLLKLLNIYSTDDVRDLSYQQRQCRFHDESMLRRSPVYSYNLCVIECRAKKIVEACGCIPHFYKKLPNERVCKASELTCALSKGETLRKIGKSKECHCLPACDTDIFTPQDEKYFDKYRWTTIKYGLGDFPKMRLKREVIFGFTDFLVNVGGAAGLFIGCSFISIAELIYFIIFKLIWSPSN